MAPNDKPHSAERGARILQHMSVGMRNEIIAGIGEFIGTFMFLFVPFVAVQVAAVTNTAVPVPPSDISGPVLRMQAPQNVSILYIAFAFGISLVVNAWIFFRISGSMFNPAVSLFVAPYGFMRVAADACFPVSFRRSPLPCF